MTVRSSHADRRRTPARTPILVLAMLTMVVLLGLATAGCSVSSADENTRTGAQTGYVGGHQVSVVPPAQRQPAPTVTGPELGTGKTISSADFPTKVVVVNVWGSWCASCRGEAAALQAASAKTKAEAQFLGINNRDYSQANGLAFERTHDITYPSIFDPSGDQLVKFFGNLPPSAIPSTLVIDKQGRIAARFLGPIDQNTLVQEINDVAAGR